MWLRQCSNPLGSATLHYLSPVTKFSTQPLRRCEKNSFQSSFPAVLPASSLKGATSFSLPLVAPPARPDLPQELPQELCSPFPGCNTGPRYKPSRPV